MKTSETPTLGQIETLKIWWGTGPIKAGKGENFKYLRQVYRLAGVTLGDEARHNINFPDAPHHSLVYPEATNSNNGGLLSDHTAEQLAIFRALHVLTELQQSNHDPYHLEMYIDGAPRTVGQRIDILEMQQTLENQTGIRFINSHLVYCVPEEVVYARNDNRGNRADDSKTAERLVVFNRDTVPAIHLVAQQIIGPAYSKSCVDSLINGNSDAFGEEGYLSFFSGDESIHFIDATSDLETVRQRSAQIVSCREPFLQLTPVLSPQLQF